jgi:hypothetical protein
MLDAPMAIFDLSLPMTDLMIWFGNKATLAGCMMHGCHNPPLHAK